MQDILYRDKPYIQLVQLELIYGFRKGWTGIDAALPERTRQAALDSICKAGRVARACAASITSSSASASRA